MLRIQVGSTESYDEEMQQFVEQGGVTLELEHSLLSVSKWETIHEKTFLGRDAKTSEEVVSYVECMNIGEEVPPDVFLKLSKENVDAINEYINAKHSATFLSEPPGGPGSREVITSELIYYWTTVFQINWEAQYWHLNRLFTLIRICNLKQGKQKKMSRAEIAQRNRALNARRRQELGTTG